MSLDRRIDEATVSGASSLSATAEHTSTDGQVNDLQDEVAKVAERLSILSSASGEWQSQVLNPTPGSKLDPSSPAFDARLWVKEFIRLTESDPKSAPSRSLGVAFKALSVFAYTTGAEFQKTTGNVVIGLTTYLARWLRGNRHARRADILRDFEGVAEKGEMLLVLGPPGSGCSTLLKSLSGETADLNLTPESYVNFQGLDLADIRSSLRGDVLYNAELDIHLAHLTVGETLTFASRARSVRHVPGGFDRDQLNTVRRDVMMAIFGLNHTINTHVGDDFVRGVSGGERKRVSIAEASLTGAKFQCWDNSTRGLDSANAVNFCSNLRLQADLLDVTSVVTLYQAPQSAYDLFDRVTLIYEGRQIFFGHTTDAKDYFENLGFYSPPRQTVPDFLTSMTSPEERRVRTGFEDLVPRSADEFAERWQSSEQRKKLLFELASYEQRHPPEERKTEYYHSRQAEQAKQQRSKSAYTISYPQQISLTLWRAYRRLLADPVFTIASLLFNVVMALILGSMFYKLKPDTSSFYYRGGLIFFSLLFNAFASQLEVLTIYAERPIVEKQNRYAFYHQSAQAIASYLTDLPYKIVNMFVFNIIIYFMANLKQEAGAFFFFCLTTFLTTLVQSAIFRTLASITRTSDQAMIPSAILSLGLMIYTGFTTPPEYMPGWSRWMAYINPLAYGFEALMANEFHDREFPCVNMVPSGQGYTTLPSVSQICSVVGSEAGSSFVNGDNYISMSFDYWNVHKWRNIGILCAFLAFFFPAYMLSAELAKPPRTRGEILVFRRSKGSPKPEQKLSLDAENQTQNRPVVAEKVQSPGRSDEMVVGKDVFHWEDLCYDIEIKGGNRRLLDHVDGWVKPGVSTILMGVSGAGKTTLLDVLATRVTTGVHRVGYVQQQDLHLSTMTVREALQFSAVLRQSAEISRSEKLDYVEHIIDTLEMREFADAVIGVPGEGLNIEQRKRLTIGVELAARPQLLIFFDEPTSGLDAQTSWAVSELIKKLTDSGQAVLCTIHQPSAILFDQFDRLLLIAPGGKTAYFGDLGSGASTLINYFEKNNAPACPAGANPAEWMLQVIESPANGSKGPDWHQVWLDSPEYQTVKTELRRLRDLPAADSTVDEGASQHQEFVASFWTQFDQVLQRTWKHFWRSPTYIWSKTILIVLSSLYLGFSFEANNSIQGLQNQLWAVFMPLILFLNINEQIMPMFLPQRALYEARERPSKIYRWSTYLLSNIFVELAWHTLMAIIMYFCWYYPVGFVRNTTPDDQAIRGFLVFLFLWVYLLFTSTFTHFAIFWIDLPETAGVLTSLFWMLCILFCGVGVPISDLPKFWSFMYRVSPATYIVGGIMSNAVANSNVTCADREILHMAPTGNLTCGEFLAAYKESAGGLVLNPTAQSMCEYCPLATTNEFLDRFQISYDTRWRDFEFTPTPIEPSLPPEIDLPIDRLLRFEPQSVALYDDTVVVKVSNERTTSSGMSFFSNERMSALVSRIGTDVVAELVEDLENFLVSRVCSTHDSSSSMIEFQPPLTSVDVTPSEAAAYIDAYFDQVHHIYPFLDVQEFTSHTTNCQRTGTSKCSKACSAIYHAVLALGSQYHQGGSFIPGSGKAWTIFQFCLGIMPDILVPPYSLTKLQALTTMSIFALNTCCLQLDHSLVYEAARMAQSLRYHKSPNAKPAHLKVFWTIYHLEKITSFSKNNSSVFADEDIGCDVPSVPESKFGDYNWFLSAIHLSRLTSIAYTTLFSTRSSLKSAEDCLNSIKHVRRGLEEWRLSVPVAFRPKEPLQLSESASPTTKVVVIQTHYLYCNLVFAMERLSLHVDPDEKLDREDSRLELMNAARIVIELVSFIAIEPHMPVFITGIMPLSAVFVLFDFVIHNPTHTETESNIAFLDQAAAYFSQLEYTSKGALPGSIISKFAGIARQYVLKLRETVPTVTISKPEMHQGIQPIWDFGPDIDFKDIDFSSIISPNSEQIPYASIDTPSPMRPDLNYPPSQDIQFSNQLGDPRSIFDFVFPD
ncbi:hypothetical protein N7517_000297 [Penicillium concentricum]|uniref:ABC transporter domain-containing protein n=1 Tax=Penicillium concentricum TaxID=293559 RepID=A0A9W9SPU0_9EURO|nr:uncharacterized protein N7517_000297 [Penicillium concentricum]KAJ5382386.1 hypothetical protein N7517_000297 [Penicillium concentricum]